MTHFSLPRLLSPTATFHLRHTSSHAKHLKESLKGLRHVWISGLIDRQKVDPDLTKLTEVFYPMKKMFNTANRPGRSQLSSKYLHNSSYYMKIVQAAITSFN